MENLRRLGFQLLLFPFSMSLIIVKNLKVFEELRFGQKTQLSFLSLNVKNVTDMWLIVVLVSDVQQNNSFICMLC